MNTYKICICGDLNSGKTTFIKRLLTGGYEKRYVATLGVEVYPLRMETNHGLLSFTIWDVAGNPKFQGLGEGYFINAHGVMIFKEFGASDSTYKKYTEMIKNIAPKCEIVYVINKVDEHEYLFPATESGDLFNISVLNEFNLKKPLLALAKKITGFNDLEITGKIY
jgi:GTP-binding nuclear protein Ran